MACKCSSENQKLFPADVKLYFDSGRSAAAPTFFPDVLVCLDCGVSEFRIPEDGTNCKHSEGQQQDNSMRPDRREGSWV